MLQRVIHTISILQPVSDPRMPHCHSGKQHTRYPMKHFYLKGDHLVLISFRSTDGFNPASNLVHLAKQIPSQ